MQIELISSKVASQTRLTDPTNPDDMSQFTDPSKTKTKIVSKEGLQRIVGILYLPLEPGRFRAVEGSGKRDIWNCECR